MSVAPSERSTVVAGCTGDVAATGGDEVWKRARCAVFEKKLHLSEHQRDKKNEERANNARGSFVRVNSKRLLCSYDVPIDDCYRILKRLHRTLSPGLRASDEKTDEAKKRRTVLYDWVSCSDFTASVIPKTPTVLWLDIDCRVCKSGTAVRGRHLKSSLVIDTVLSVVADYRDELTTSADPDRLYVTRGTTCGMHLFFPQIVVLDECRLLDIRNEVDTRLRVVEATVSAAVDTGCSALPLPLARKHNGVTRIAFEGRTVVRRTHVTRPTLQDFASVTTFYHLIADRFDEVDNASSTSSTVTSNVTVENRRPTVDRDRDATGALPATVVDDTSLGEAPVSTASCRVDVASDTIDTEQNPQQQQQQQQNHPNSTDVSDGKEKKTDDVTEVGGTSAGSDGGRAGVAAATATPRENGSDISADETSGSSVVSVAAAEKSGGSVVSVATSGGSKKRELVQTDLRDLCAKMMVMNDRKRKRRTDDGESASSSSSASASDVSAPASKHFRPADCERAAAAETVKAEPMETDDTASSFLYAGYVPPPRPTVDESTASSAAAASSSQNACAAKNTFDDGPSTAAVAGAAVASASGGDSRRASDESLPADARVPILLCGARRKSGDEARRIAAAKEEFERNMSLSLDGQENQTHETDIQFLLSGHNTELDFYATLLKDSSPLGAAAGTEFDGLRTKGGCSLYDRRETCPPAMFPEHMPYVLHTEDYVSETEWIRVLTRYFDEYLNNAPTLLVMSYVLREDANVVAKLCEPTRLRTMRLVQNCLSRFKYDAVASQRANDARRGLPVSDRPKHPYDEKCAVVCGLIAVCSVAFEMRTPLFTDFSKTARTLLTKNQQTLKSLNTSTMSTAGSARTNDCDDDDDEYVYDTSGAAGRDYDRLMFDDSVSQTGRSDASEEDDNTPGDRDRTPLRVKRSPPNVGDNHVVLASVLRWNYTSLADATLWCLFFYYYHVNKDSLERITNETMHGGLMVTALLQAYYETAAHNSPVDVRLVCKHVYVLDEALKEGDDRLGKRSDDESERSLMPPPTTATRKAANGGRKSAASESKKQQYAARTEDSANARRENGDGGGGDKNKRGKKNDTVRYVYKTNFNEVLKLAVRRYLRPITFDETTVVYTETGYDAGQNGYVSAFASDKDLKRNVMDVFNGSTLKYTMPHGDLLMYNTDVMGTVHRRSVCSNNLVLNVFENMYGGCMAFLTRRYNNHLKLFNRFNGDAYRLVVECRHAMNGLVRSIDTSYLNLILRQPIVPPVLEADITVRNMFMCDEELRKGAFACLNAMDYVRAINMFTRHARFSQKNCQAVESFLDGLVTGAAVPTDDDEARGLFRTVYLFYTLYIFEVLYKIRHAYMRDGSYSVCVERLSWELDVRVLLKLFFGAREFKTPRGLSPEVVRLLESPADGVHRDRDSVSNLEDEGYEDDADDGGGDGRSAAARCINTRPLVSACLPDKMSRMTELFGKKGLTVMKSYAPLEQRVCPDDETARLQEQQRHRHDPQTGETTGGRESDESGGPDGDAERTFLGMTQSQLEDALYSPDKWYDNCRKRVVAVRTDDADRTNAERGTDGMDTFMDATSMDTFLRTQLRVHIDNNRLAQIERAVRRDKKDFHFCTFLPLRVKMMALVLATHSVKRLTAGVAEDFCRKEYRLERAGVLVMKSGTDGGGDDPTDERPDQEWANNWNRLLCKRRNLLAYCRSLAESEFPDNYFGGLQPDRTYQALYEYMLSRPKYVTLQALKHQPWAKDVCIALNYLLVTNGYDPELVELCLRLFLGFEWPGQWAKRIFVWKSNSNAGKSFFFEHVLQKAFDQSTCINDPKGGKDNAPEKSEYYRNFVLMINEFANASACELKKLCSTSSYKFRMNFGNQMIQAFVVGKMVFNCNTLPVTTDHATIQRVALVPLPFWFQRRQTIVESMLNWTRGHCSNNEYEKHFKRNVSRIMNIAERRFFLEHQETKNEDDLFNKPNEISLQLLNELTDQNETAKASMFLVQNKTSHVYMASYPPLNTIVGGVVTITKYFCRFRFFNNIKEPVDYSVLPKACNAAACEWQRISQPYFEWKDRYRVQKDTNVRTKISAIYASLNYFAKNHAKTTTFFDLRQFFECDFAEQKIPWNSAKEDEYNIRMDPWN